MEREHERYQAPEGYYYCMPDACGYIHQPGRRYCRHCYPPRGRGRGEDLYSPRRAQALMKAVEATKLRWEYELTYEQIARRLGYGSRAAAYNAIWRLNRRRNADQRAADYAKKQRKPRSGLLPMDEYDEDC